MSGFNGRWVFQQSSDAEAYFKAIHAPQEFLDKQKQIEAGVKKDPNFYIEEIKFDKAAGTVHRKVFINGQLKKDSGDFKLGGEVDYHLADGRPAKVKVVVDSDTKVTRYETAGDISTVTTFELSGDTVTATQKAGGVSNVATYKRS